MNWKQKTCIAVTLFFLCSANTSVNAMPQEQATAEQTQDAAHEDWENELVEAKELLKQKKYAEAETICLNTLKTFEDQNGFPNPIIFRVLGDVYRMERKNEEEIALWKRFYDLTSPIAQGEDEKYLLLPIARLCSAYQANRDFSSTEPYLQRGEKILQQYQDEDLKDFLQERAIFQKVALFNRIGQGKLTPAEARKEAETILSAGHLPSDRDMLEVLDIIFVSATIPPNDFSDAVAYYRLMDYTMTIREGANQVKRMNCLYRAAYTYAFLLGQCHVANSLLESVYQEIQEEYNLPHTPKVAQAMLDVLSTKAVISCLVGNHADTIAIWDMVWKLRESVPQRQNDLKSWKICFIGTFQSYLSMRKTDEWRNKYESLAKEFPPDSFFVSLGKMICTVFTETSSEEERKQALRNFQDAADKECAKRPDLIPMFHWWIKMIANALPESLSSSLRLEQVSSNNWENSFEESSLISRGTVLAEAEKAYQAKDFQKALPLYMQSAKTAIDAGDIYGPISLPSILGWARSSCQLGYNARQDKFDVDAETAVEHGLYVYELLINLCEEYRDTTSGLTREERSRWFSTMVEAYDEAARNFHFCHPMSKKKEYYDRKIFDTLEKCKARILLEQYAEQIADESGVLTETEIAKLRTYRQEAQRCRETILRLEATQGKDSDSLQGARKEMERVTNDEQQFRKFLQDKYPTYQALSNPKLITSEDGQKLLPPNTSFFEYSLRPLNPPFQTGLLELVSLTGNNVSSIIDIESIYIDEWASYCKLLSYSNSESDFDRFFDVYRLWKIDAHQTTEGQHVNSHYLIQNRAKDKDDKPLHGHIVRDPKGFEAARKELAEKWGTLFANYFANNLDIHPGQRIIIAPDDRVSPMPFETLTYNGKSFAEIYDISYTPSLSVYALMKERGEANAAIAGRKELFAMGNAIYDGNVGVARSKSDSFDQLPGTATELKQVGALFPDEEQKNLLQQKDATESHLKELDESGELAQYKYLLFATHGVFEEGNPMANAIVLSYPDKSKSAENDGYVTVGEWMGYHLHSDLVYLSACETGRGTSYAGEGLIGLPYALTIAGNKSTIMTLWKIDDEPTAEFSKVFFSRLIEGQPAVQALAETKRDFLHHDNPAYRDPHIWGAFQLYGE